MPPTPGQDPGGFLSGFLSVVGPRMAEKHAEHLKLQNQTKEAEFKAWFDAWGTKKTRIGELQQKQNRTPQEDQELQQAETDAEVYQKNWEKISKGSPPLAEMAKKVTGLISKLHQKPSPKGQMQGPAPGAQPPANTPAQAAQPAQQQAGPLQPPPSSAPQGGAPGANPQEASQPSQPLQPPPQAKPAQPAADPMASAMFTNKQAADDQQKQQSDEKQRSQEASQKFATDEKIRMEQATSEDRRVLAGDRDAARKELEEVRAHNAELKAQNAKELATIQAELKAQNAKELATIQAELKAQNAKELATMKAAQKPVAAAHSAGTSVAEQVKKAYTPGGKSIANPTGNETVDVGAWDYLFTGHIPFTGFSGGAKDKANARELMVGRASELLADAGLTPKDIPAVRAKVKGDSAAFSKISSMGASVRQFEGTLEANMATAQRLSDAWSRGDIQLVNRVAAAFKTGTGDSEALNLATQLHGVANEWGKIMAGSTSAAGVPVSEATATNLLFDKGISNGQLKSMMEKVIKPDIANRTGAIQGEQDRLVKSLRDELSLGQESPIGPSPRGFLAGPPPSGSWEATATGKDGHKIGYRGGKWYDIKSGAEVK